MGRERKNLATGRARAHTVVLAFAPALPSTAAKQPPSGYVGLSALGVRHDERVEIDELRIVLEKVAMVPAAAMDMHQRLHAAGVEKVDMLMAQRHRQQRLR